MTEQLIKSISVPAKSSSEIPLKPHQKVIAKRNYTSEDLYWLSRVISAEAKGEPYEGQVAVGNVVLNRVKSKKFPDTIKQVVFQKRQFSSVSNKSIYAKPTDMALQSAKDVLEGKKVLPDNVLFFYAHKEVSRGNLIRDRKTYSKIKNHTFAY